SSPKAPSQPKAPAPIAPTLPVGVPDVQKPGAANVGPPEATYYFPIPLGGKTPGHPVTGVFLPNGFTFAKEMDVILFFHGNQRGPKMPSSWLFDTIYEYWGGSFPKGAPPIQFRDDLIKSKKRSVVLIAPTLGQYPGAAYSTDDSSYYGI